MAILSIAPLGRTAEPVLPQAEVSAPQPWPAATAPLSVIELPPPGERKLRVYLDAGHGTEGNLGATNVFCEFEHDFTLALANAVKAQLEGTGHFSVRVSRRGEPQPSYQRRLREAEAWPADVLISLHWDTRGLAEFWRPSPGHQCLRQDLTPGFAILWSDDAEAGLRQKRSALAAAVANRMAEAGFLAYDGVDYEGLYGPGPVPGAFVDRHQPGQRIFMLRRPRIPSIIVETHHALDLQEAIRWSESRTWTAFSASLAAGILDLTR